MKKTVSMLLALILIVTALTIAPVLNATAEMTASAGVSDEIAFGESGDVIYFDATDSGWINIDYVMVYIYDTQTGVELISWASSKQGRMMDMGDNVWMYDFGATLTAAGKPKTPIAIEPGVQYSIIFTTNFGAQTHDLLMDSTCMGDVAYCDPDAEHIENPVDSNKVSNCCRWKNNKELGPVMYITSIGNVVGEVIPDHTTAYAMFADFLNKKLNTARIYSNKDDQRLIDDISEKLGLNATEVEKAIKETGVSVEWSKNETAQPALCRYYFQMPDGVHGNRDYQGDPIDSWYNEYSDGAYVYWWGDTSVPCTDYPGIPATLCDEEQHIYYADIPQDAEVFVWNNGVDGSADPSQPISEKVRSTVHLFSGEVEPDEFDTMPEGAESLNGCIFIVYPNDSYAEYIVNRPLDGSWYFYYGNGCYGMYAEDSDHFKSVEENCCNPDHSAVHPPRIGDVTDIIRGDYDSDGEITIMDATRVQNIIAKLVDRPSETFLEQIDADGDKDLTIMDATRIQNVMAKLMDIQGNRIE